VNPVGLLLGPLALARQAAADVASLAAFAQSFDVWGQRGIERVERLIEVGDENVRVGREMIDLAQQNIASSAETNESLRGLDARIEEMLRVAAVLEHELPALTEAAPPVQAAAERAERIAARIPGVRGA
jgi:hypothetical protein